MPLIKMTSLSERDMTDAPKRLIQQTRTRARKGIKKWAGIFKSQYLKTVASWKTKPTFTIEYKSTPEGEEALIFTENNIYRFLHDGTRLRWALMSFPFEAKTTPRLLGSGPGAGRALLKGKGQMNAAGYMYARDGIEAREWTQEIIKLYESPFQHDMNNIVFGDFTSS